VDGCPTCKRLERHETLVADEIATVREELERHETPRPELVAEEAALEALLRRIHERRAELAR